MFQELLARTKDGAGLILAQRKTNRKKWKQNQKKLSNERTKKASQYSFNLWYLYTVSIPLIISSI